MDKGRSLLPTPRGVLKCCSFFSARLHHSLHFSTTTFSVRNKSKNFRLVITIHWLRSWLQEGSGGLDFVPRFLTFVSIKIHKGRAMKTPDTKIPSNTFHHTLAVSPVGNREDKWERWWKKERQPWCDPQLINQVLHAPTFNLKFSST